MTRTIDYLASSARRILFFFNPTAGARSRQRRIAQCVAALEGADFAVETISDPDQLAEIAGVPDPNLRSVVAAGGDGTVAMVANRTAPSTPIAILPFGTENLLAKYCETTKVASVLGVQIARGATVYLDVGEANGRLFLLMAGCGFDAEVVHRLHASRRGHIRHSSYIKPILDSIRRYEYPALRVRCRQVEPSERSVRTETLDAVDAPETVVAPVRWVFIVNLPRYAGGLNFVPAAVGTDGLLDVCTFRHGSFARGLRYLWGVVRRRHLAWPDVTHCQARAIRVESDQPVAFQLDGDPGGMLPVDIRVLPARLRLVVDTQWAMRHGFEQTALDREVNGHKEP